MKKYLMIFCVLALASCTVDVPLNIIDSSEALCTQNEGVKRIRLNEVQHTVVCNNGAIFEHRANARLYE